MLLYKNTLREQRLKNLRKMGEMVMQEGGRVIAIADFDGIKRFSLKLERLP